MNGKIVGIFLCLSMGGCGLMKDAKQAFDNDIDGFKSEFARLYLKEERKNVGAP